MATPAAQAGGHDFPGFTDVSRAGAGFRRMPRLVDAESWEVKPRESSATFRIGDRVFHQKFGYGVVEAIDDTKLDIAFDESRAQEGAGQLRAAGVMWSLR